MNELVDSFQEFRKILCVCPCCGDLYRVSDLNLKAKGEMKKTWLDDYEKKAFLVSKKEALFDEQKSKLREAARKKGRKAAEKVVNNVISPEFKALKLDVSDVKPILNPIDFVVFKGMTKNDSVNDIILLSKYIKNPELNTIRKQIEKVVLQKKYDWQVARIDEKGNIGFEC